MSLIWYLVYIPLGGRYQVESLVLGVGIIFKGCGLSFSGRSPTTNLRPYSRTWICSVPSSFAVKRLGLGVRELKIPSLGFGVRELKTKTKTALSIHIKDGRFVRYYL